VEINKILGNKELFAVEYEVDKVQPHLQGKIRLWLGACYVGAYEDVEMLLVVLSQLERVKSDKLNGEAYRNLNFELAYEKIKENDGKFFLSLGESFDDFSIVIYFLDGAFTVVWELLDNPFFTYPNYPQGLQLVKIPEESFTQVVEEFKKQITSL